MIQLQEVK